MNLDHIEYYEEVHFPTGTRTIQARYRIESKAVTSEGLEQINDTSVLTELAKKAKTEDKCNPFQTDCRLNRPAVSKNYFQRNNKTVPFRPVFRTK